jgi:hypothetical protein
MASSKLAKDSIAVIRQVALFLHITCRAFDSGKTCDCSAKEGEIRAASEFGNYSGGLLLPADGRMCPPVGTARPCEIAHPAFPVRCASIGMLELVICFPAASRAFTQNVGNILQTKTVTASQMLTASVRSNCSNERGGNDR